MPWLAGTALLHSAVVMEKRNALKVWTILLAILTFSLSLIGTFLVRSGVLTSVHSFASDPTRGVFILAILVLFIGGGLALFAWRAPLLKQGGLFAPISREGALVFNNLFLTTACATVFVGTLYPLALEAFTGEKISVGAPFFNLTFGPLFVPLLFAVPFGPLLAWKRGDLLGVAQRLMAAFGVGARRDRGRVRDRRAARRCWRRSASGLAFFVMAGAVTDLVERTGLFRVPLATVRHARAPGCRARPGARRSRISASGCRCSASSAPAPGAPSASSRLKPGADRFAVRLRSDLRRPRRSAPGPNYSELVAKFTVRSGGAVHRRDGAVEAHLRRARDLDHRSGADDARREPALSVARRSQSTTARSRSGSITSRWCC